MEPKEFDFAKLSLAESTNGLLANPAMTCPTDRSFSSGLVTTDSVGNVSLTDGSKESALLTAGFIVSAMLVGGPGLVKGEDKSAGKVTPPVIAGCAATEDLGLSASAKGSAVG